MVGSEKGAVVSGSATVADLTCASSTTLEALVTCIRKQIPQSGSNGFVVPNATEQTDWRAVVKQMLQGSCDFTLPASLSGIMQIRTFTDAANGRDYCVLMEVRDANGSERIFFGPAQESDPAVEHPMTKHLSTERSGPSCMSTLTENEEA
jgi:hypothetical protein